MLFSSEKTSSLFIKKVSLRVYAASRKLKILLDEVPTYKNTFQNSTYFFYAISISPVKNSK